MESTSELDLDKSALDLSGSKRWREEFIKVILFLCSFLSVLTTFVIVFILIKEAGVFFREVPVFDFLFGTRWAPLLLPRSFGVLPLVCGTLLIVVGTTLFALPIGLATAIYLSEYAPSYVRSILKPVLEVLAGIPTVVYGYFALTFITPMLRMILPDVQIFNAASASIVVGIMILPMVASLCDDTLRAVPDEVNIGVVVPSALSGIMASFVLALSRAIGETMAVTLAAGATPRMTVDPFVAIQTMTAYIVQVSLGDTPAGEIGYQTIFAVSALLFVITLIMNIFSSNLLRRFREVYE